MLENLGKLLKHEFRFYFRILPPLYLCLVLAVLLAGFQARQSELESSLLRFIWLALFVAVVVVNIVLIIQRFRDNLMRNPGYIMFTLPVTVWALAASKAIAAFCMVLMSAISLFVSASAYSALAYSSAFAVADFFGLRTWIDKPADIIPIFLLASITIFQSICLIYAVMSASHILPRFRFAACVAMYFVIINFVEQPVFRSLESPAASFSYSFARYIPYGLASLAFAVIFFGATGLLLKNRLNLE